MSLYEPADRPQDRVSGVVTEAVVAAFKVVDVEHDQAEGFGPPRRPVQLGEGDAIVRL